jgi:uncharacterized surface protein with fasciclin (FAS1) repeats
MNRSISKSILATGLISMMISCAAPDSGTSSHNSDNFSQTGQSGVMDDFSNPNVVQVAIVSEDHSTLVAALKAANYVDALSNVGPFTVFAPNNEAFGELPKGTLETLIKPENQRQLRDILEYHVLLGVYKPEDFSNGRKLGTAHGNSLMVEVAEDGSKMINGAKILGTVVASNGIIHVVDKVLLPE